MNPVTAPGFGLILFSLALGASPLAGADKMKSGDTAAIIFAHPLAEGGAASKLPEGRRDSAVDDALRPMSGLIASTLPGFDPKPVERDPNRIEGQDDFQQVAPLVMQPFTVADSRALELTKPDLGLLDRLAARRPLLRKVGQNFTSTLTFVDLGTDSNWRPFSKSPPPALTVRYTLSW